MRKREIAEKQERVGVLGFIRRLKNWALSFSATFIFIYSSFSARI